MNKPWMLRFGGTAALLVWSLPLATPAQQSSESALGVKLDRLIAEGKNQRELAQYLFNTRGCKNCHTIGHDEKLGFTAKGKELAKAFTGCIDMLTALTVIVQLPADKRSAKQAQIVSHFEEFGCTTCHKVAPGELSMTTVGAKLKNLHLGCVDVEKLVADRRTTN